MIFEKIVLMLVATPGMIAPAATATKPTINAYSIKSWPRVPYQIFHILSLSEENAGGIISSSIWHARRSASKVKSPLSHFSRPLSLNTETAYSCSP